MDLENDLEISDPFQSQPYQGVPRGAIPCHSPGWREVLQQTGFSQLLRVMAQVAESSRWW